MAQFETVVKIEAADLLEKAAKEKYIQNLAELPLEVLEKLDQMRTPKAIDALKKKWSLIKAFI